MELVKLNNQLPVAPIMADDTFVRYVEQFGQRLNATPDAAGVQKTPDGQAETLTISFVESKLDEIYLRQWGCDKCEFSVVANELCCDVILWVLDPSTGIRITRPGTAAIAIMVDAAPQDVKADKRLKNEWALNLANKKPNALKLNRPAVKSLALKNAAQSLGVVFGRNINRKIEDVPEDYYTQELDAKETIDLICESMAACNSMESLLNIWAEHPDLQKNTHFKKHFAEHKTRIIPIERIMHLINDAVSKETLEKIKDKVPESLMDQFNQKLQSFL